MKLLLVGALALASVESASAELACDEMRAIAADSVKGFKTLKPTGSLPTTYQPGGASSCMVNNAWRGGVSESEMRCVWKLSDRAAAEIVYTEQANTAAKCFDGTKFEVAKSGKGVVASQGSALVSGEITMSIGPAKEDDRIAEFAVKFRVYD